MNIVVVGAGPSGLHFALSALARGRKVTMIDVGNQAPRAPSPNVAIADFKDTHPDSVAYFLGEDYAGAAIPDIGDETDAKYFQLPPSKQNVFERPPHFSMQQDGVRTLISFAAGGLAECWTGGSYPLNDDDLKQFPFSYTALEPHYAEVAARIGIGGANDDLAAYYPLHANLAPPIALDANSSDLLARYQQRKRKSDVVLGRSRHAALSAARGERGGCSLCGRCLWGCPSQSLYTPSISLKEVLAHPNFTYIPGRYASHFKLATGDTLASLVVFPADGGAAEEVRGDAFVLAAGTINTSAIFLRTLYHERREIACLDGLMDNRQILAPFFNFGMFGKTPSQTAYQYHQLAIGIPAIEDSPFVHGQITSFTTTPLHSVVQQVPADLKSSLGASGLLRPGLAVLNLNFHDDRRAGNYVTLDPSVRDATGSPSLRLRYRPRPDESKHVRRTLKRTREFFLGLGAPLVPGMLQVRPMGASVHYAGTLPMARQRAEFALTEDGQSHDFGNLFVADGAGFPFLPAKNLTFTLMANAARIAEKMT